jgi:hypothetical protein
MKTFPFQLLLTVVVLIIWTACSKNDEKLQSELTGNEFILQPAHPVANDEVKLITYDCQYNHFGYITKKDFDIEVVKHFNSMMKLACILQYDTISLGNLEPGTYTITFSLVDLSTAVLTDSISYSETQTLVVKK